MDVQVQSIRFVADQKLITFVKQKLSKLNLFFDQIVDAEVYLKIDRANTNDNKIVEIKLNIPGKDLFAKKQFLNNPSSVKLDSLFNSSASVETRIGTILVL